MLPLAALATVLLLSRAGQSLVPPRVWKLVAAAIWALAELAKFLLATAFCLLLAGGLAEACSIAGSLLDPLLKIVDPRLCGMLHDPRSWIVDTYIQRNALVVGFMMGFAIIPLIYTIADDALSSVPAHLRSASLGAGATHWQTAVRIVIPTAMSGLFSAVMIGLGRAVGETMIMLMATGNTPIMEMNVFNGFQTLAAAIATGVPEAPVGGTLFRMLFLAGLTLFFFTFLVNTVAEVVRLRFRRRAHEALSLLSPRPGPRPIKLPRLRPAHRSGSSHTSLTAHGEPMLWLSGGALAFSLMMIAGLLGTIAWFGLGTFWPLPVTQATLADGKTVMGEITREGNVHAACQPISNRRAGNSRAGAGRIASQTGQFAIGRRAKRAGLARSGDGRASPGFASRGGNGFR